MADLHYGWIPLVVFLAAVAFTMTKVGMEGFSPMSEILFFGGGVIGGIALACFLFLVLPGP